MQGPAELEVRVLGTLALPGRWVLGVRFHSAMPGGDHPAGVGPVGSTLKPGRAGGVSPVPP